MQLLLPPACTLRRVQRGHLDWLGLLSCNSTFLHKVLKRQLVCPQLRPVEWDDEDSGRIGLVGFGQVWFLSAVTTWFITHSAWVLL